MIKEIVKRLKFTDPMPVFNGVTVRPGKGTRYEISIPIENKQ